jgi:prefoldin beta subunit
MEATIAARQKLDYQQSESESVLKVSLVSQSPWQLIDIRADSYSPPISLLPWHITGYITQELKVLKSHNTVYKLIGPGLMPQDPEEAKSTVEKRLEFIKKEMSVSRKNPKI